VSEPPVLAHVDGRAGRLTLNRPKALHALTTEMCQLMTQALLAWRDDPAVELILVDHAGERGFCAGGDIRMLADSGAGDSVGARAFFHAEYRLNHLIHAYPKPYVAVMDGVTMGGGVGVSVHGSHRIATERTVFAMPETGIGLFPDVGGGWFLPRLAGEVGTWLALTGARIKGEGALAIGVATHFALSDQIDALKRALARDGLAALAGLRTQAPPLPHPAGAIAALFGHDSVEAILAALEADGGEWAKAQLATLASKSPQTLKVALRQLREGRALARFEDVMAMEYRIGARVVSLHDFQEGVRAVIIDKDNAPLWSPATLEAVTQARLDAIFAPLPEAEEWTPLPALVA
jgi:enoyl-CoA hydratase